MRTKAFVFLLSLFIVAFLLIQIQTPITTNGQVSTAEVPKDIQQQLRETYGKLPLYFIENQWHLDPRVAYYIQGGDKSIYFTGSGVTFALTGPAEETDQETPEIRPASLDLGKPGKESPAERQRWVVKLDFVDANPNAQPVGQEPTDAVISYFKGPREEWTTGLPTYASLVY
ncbi:MAG: hypothetical protein V3T65_03635, partial [Acidobacteriota bacterium]